LIDGLTKGATLNSDTDSNIWTDASKGERYIRALAKRQLLRRRDPQARRGAGSGPARQRYRQELFEQTHSRIASGEMAAYA
jgi:stalled ribosome alternative rescue factor ArfA